MFNVCKTFNTSKNTFEMILSRIFMSTALLLLKQNCSLWRMNERSVDIINYESLITLSITEVLEQCPSTQIATGHHPGPPCFNCKPKNKE
jgi:hypothetical protein